VGYPGTARQPHVNQIGKDRTAGSKTGSNSLSKFLYTFGRGNFFFHSTSLPLVFASRGLSALPLFVQIRENIFNQKEVGGKLHQVRLV